MNLKNKLIFLFLNVSLRLIFARELIQIQTITRHGERSPCFSYPSDPYKHLWTKSLGQLTDKGVNQLKEVGSFLRTYYKDFLPIYFHKKEIYIKSSDTDRTISSALACMSSLFENQIVPVHTVPKSYDYLLKMTSVCPYHKKLLLKEFSSEKYKHIINKYSSFYKELELGTGLQNADFHLSVRICDAITVWRQLNLTFPDWLGPDAHEKCMELGDMKFIISYSNIELTKFRGGPLAINIVDGMIKRATSFLERKPGMKMIGFFSHDSTMSALLSHIGSYNKLKPPLASLIVFELYYDPDSVTNDNNKDPLAQFFVRLLYRNDTSLKTPYVLNISICSEEGHGSHSSTQFCRLDVLYRELKQRTLKDLPRECGVSNIIDYWFASNEKLKLLDNSLDNIINDIEFKPGSSSSTAKYESDLFVNIFVPLLLVEILVLYLFYRVSRRRNQ